MFRKVLVEMKSSHSMGGAITFFTFLVLFSARLETKTQCVRDKAQEKNFFSFTTFTRTSLNNYDVGKKKKVYRATVSTIPERVEKN